MSHRSRRRLLKRVLRFMPRRARLHHYPLIGRFAKQLRPRGYLWSLRRGPVLRAYYAGAVLAFLPLFGVQLPLAVVASLSLRANLMVLGGLQMITNPLTAGPIYYATHQLGGAVLNQLRDQPIPVSAAKEEELAEMSGYVAESIAEPLGAVEPQVRWTTRAREAVTAMILGGILIGAVLGLVLDKVDAWVRIGAAHGTPPKSVPARGPPDPDRTAERGIS